MGNHSNGTGKPHKLETQIMVGALPSGNSTNKEAVNTEINDCRPHCGYRTWLIGYILKKRDDSSSLFILILFYLENHIALIKGVLTMIKWISVRG